MPTCTYANEFCKLLVVCDHVLSIVNSEVVSSSDWRVNFPNLYTLSYHHDVIGPFRF